jgi:hypothetical protein
LPAELVDTAELQSGMQRLQFRQRADPTSRIYQEPAVVVGSPRALSGGQPQLEPFELG